MMDASADPAVALASLCDRYWDFVCFEQPLLAILAGKVGSEWVSGGEPVADDVLLRESPADHDRRAASAQRLRAELAQVPFGELRGQDRLTHRLLAHDLGLTIDAHAIGDHLRPSLHPMGPQFALNYWADATTLACAQDAERYLRRLRTIPAGLAGLVACLEAGLQQGIRYPRLVIERAIGSLRALLARPLAESSFLRPFRQPAAQAPEMRSLQDTAESVLNTAVMPALAELAQFFEQRLAPVARSSIACTDDPRGAEFYAFLIERYTTERRDAGEIHALGLAEVARLDGEMQQIAAQAGFPGDLNGYRTALLAAPGQVLPSAEALLERIEVLSKRIDARVPEFFGRVPRMTYGVRSIPAALSPFMPPAYAQPNPADGSAAGVHWITSLPERCPAYLHIPLALHEAWPGHLMHIALMQETALPSFRRHGGERYSACVEGWALYCEGLGEEWGLYDTPDKRYGRLEMEMWRACRLVVDTGIHAQSWSREQAIEFMDRHLSMPTDTIRAEVDRYIGLPGQALAYQIGLRCVRAIRADAQARLGDGFRLREFHDALLGVGAVTLPVWREAMRDWAASRLAA